jgi:hypothetical protein
MPQVTHDTVSTLLLSQIVYLPVQYSFVITALGPTNLFALVRSDKPATCAGGRRGVVAMAVSVLMVLTCGVLLIINM